MAAALTALVVAGCLVYSVFVGPVSVARVQPGDWIADQANVLSESTEDSLRSYDQSFDNNYSVIAVATVSSTRGWEMEDYALKLADQWAMRSSWQISGNWAPRILCCCLTLAERTPICWAEVPGLI